MDGADGFEDTLSYGAAAAGRAGNGRFGSAGTHCGLARGASLPPAAPPTPIGRKRSHPTHPRWTDEQRRRSPRRSGAPPEDGKLFSTDALDNSLMPCSGPRPVRRSPRSPDGRDASQAAPAAVPGATPARPLFDEFRAHPACRSSWSLSVPPRPAAAAPRPIHKPIVQPVQPPVEPLPNPCPRCPSSRARAPTSRHPRPPLRARRVDGWSDDHADRLDAAEGVNLNGLLIALDEVSGVAGALTAGYTASSRRTRRRKSTQTICSAGLQPVHGQQGQLEKMRAASPPHPAETGRRDVIDRREWVS
jgi:hypothetical protein